MLKRYLQRLNETIMKLSNRIASFLLIVLIYGCSQSLIISTNIPSPLVNQVDNIRVLVNYDENIINYQFKSTNIEKNESPWEIEFNDSHKKLFDKILNGFFNNSIQMEPNSEPLNDANYIVINIKLDKFEFLTPSLASNDKYSVWLKYDILLTNTEREYSEKWNITGYGEQETASLNQNQALINAIDLALRDTGANLTIKMEEKMESIVSAIT